MSHFVMPATMAGLAVPPAPAQGLADAPMFAEMPIIDGPTLADEASLPHLVYQPQTGGGDLWQSGFDFTAMS
jgi:hypothetical protein